MSKTINHDEILAEIKEFAQWQIELRRWLHQNPELVFEEFKTSARLQEELKKLDIPFTTGWGKGYVGDKKSSGTGILAYVGTKKAPCIGIRADMDALPVTEKTKIDFPSQTPGRMHACGHDGHMAMLMGVAKYLKKHEKEIEGTVCLIFQPAEEGGGGAKFMVDEGCLNADPPVQAILGLHVVTHYKIGEFYCRPGPILASASSFKIEVKGAGGHGSMPSMANDPIATASLIIQGAYTLIARKTSAMSDDDVAVISVTAVDTPQSANVIPPYATLRGTCRALCEKKMDFLQTSLTKIAQKTAEMFDQTATFQITGVSYPVTLNNAGLYDWSFEQIKETKIEGGLKHLDNTLMGAEDFSFFAQKIPGCYYFMGVTPPEATSFPAMHSDMFYMDESSLVQGSAFLAFLGRRLLVQTKKSAFKLNY